MGFVATLKVVIEEPKLLSHFNFVYKICLHMLWAVKNCYWKDDIIQTALNNKDDNKTQFKVPTNKIT